MPSERSSHLTSGWLPHVVAAVSVAIVLTALATPRAVSTLRPGQARGAAELAAEMAAPDPMRIAENIRSWTLFPPDEQAGRMLSAALAACPLKGRSDAQRVELAERLYAITNGSALSGAALDRTLDAFRRAAAASRCDPLAIDTLISALRQVARTDPRPRADWW